MKRRIVSLLAFLVVTYALAGYFSSRVRWMPDLVEVTDPPALAPGDERTLRGVASIHTEYSHDATGTIDDVARAARGADLDFVLVGDHPPGPQPWVPAEYHDSILIAYGLEVATEAGRGLVFGLSEPLEGSELSPDDLWDLFDDPRVTGVVVHGRSPRERERWKLPEAGAMHGWEVLDLSESARRTLASPWSVYHAGALLLSGLSRSIPESLLRMERLGFSGPAVAAYDTMTMLGPITAMAGLNHHPKSVRAGKPFPAYEPFFKTLVNHVVVREGATGDADEVIRGIASGIHRGEVFISMGDAEGASAFRMAVADAAGNLTPMGGEVARRPGLGLLTSQIGGGDRQVIFRLLRNGEQVGVYRGTSLSVPIEDHGVYRVEVYRYAWATGDLYFDLRPWIFTNPVRVIDPDAVGSLAAVE